MCSMALDSVSSADPAENRSVMTLFPVSAANVILHEPAPHLLHRSYGGLLRRRGQKRPGPILKLPRPLGGDDDEPVGAQFRIVRNRILRVVSDSFGHFSKPRSYEFMYAP